MTGDLDFNMCFKLFCDIFRSPPICGKIGHGLWIRIFLDLFGITAVVEGNRICGQSISRVWLNKLEGHMGITGLKGWQVASTIEPAHTHTPFSGYPKLDALYGCSSTHLKASNHVLKLQPDG